MDFAKTKPYLLLLVLSLVFLASRIVNLQALPIFNDEAMYINWGRLIASNPAKYWDISLTDGQQPFFFVLTTLSWLSAAKYFLIAARMISVLSGLGTMLVLYFLGKEVVNQNLLSLKQRGFSRKVETSFGKVLPLSCKDCGACIEECPVGALDWKIKS